MNGLDGRMVASACPSIGRVGFIGDPSSSITLIFHSEETCYNYFSSIALCDTIHQQQLCGSTF